MKYPTTKIGKYHVEIDGDGTGCTWCHVHDNLLGVSASLPLLQSEGGFEDDDGKFYPIPEATVNKIEAWAVGTGQY
jgi:hypothetical protein